MIHNQADNEMYRNQAHARLDDLIEQATMEQLTGEVLVSLSFQQGVIIVVRRILNATDKTIAID